MEQTKLIEYFDKSEKNQQLLRLFESKWGAIEKIYSEIQNAVQDEEDWIVMHLACIPYNYEKMKYKILIVGQENNGWDWEYKSAKASMLFSLDFHDMRRWDNRFFNFPYNFCQSINDCDNENYSKKSYLAWVNLKEFSFDSDPKKPLPEKVQNIIDNEFNILEEEIKIIAPDIVLFLTGPKYDCHIQKQLSGVEFKEVANYQIGHFARVEHKVLPKNSFRIYHPGYLRRKGLENEYLEKLKKECGL